MKFESILNLLTILPILAASCTPSDGERCGDGFYYEDGLCHPCPVDGGDTDTNTSSDSDADTDTDTDTVTDTDTEPDGGGGPTGLGEFCDDMKDCEGYDADFCLADPGTGEGVCTIQNCITDPDDCPEQWWCCIMPDITGWPPLCLPDKYYKKYSGICENE